MEKDYVFGNPDAGEESEEQMALFRRKQKGLSEYEKWQNKKEVARVDIEISEESLDEEFTFSDHFIAFPVYAAKAPGFYTKPRFYEVFKIKLSSYDKIEYLLNATKNEIFAGKRDNWYITCDQLKRDFSMPIIDSDGLNISATYVGAANDLGVGELKKFCSPVIHAAFLHVYSGILDLKEEA